MTLTSSPPPAATAAATLFLLQLLLISTTIATKTFTYPNFQEFHVKQAIQETKPTTLKISNYQQLNENENKWRLRLIHRDKLVYLLSNKTSTTTMKENSIIHNHNHTRLFHARMERDVKRVSTLLHRLSGETASFYEPEDFGAEVVSGMNQGSGEYFVRIGVGSPPRDQYMVIDSGSDIVWVQCKPCTQCYHQTDPLFDPSNSASFIGVPCSSSLCDRVDNSGCNSGSCRYEVSYGDGSYTKGTLAIETITFGGVTVRNVAIGCGHRNRGMFTGAAGLLGLGGGSMSFVGQLGGQTGGAFSYCLVSRGSGSSGLLEFGRAALPVGAAWIPLVHNPRAPSFYYIGLSGLGVGGMQVPLPENVFGLTETGMGGVVMDTGTAVTRLPTPAYEAFRDEFISQTTNLPRANGVSIFDTCYNLFGFVSVRVPTVSFYFSDGPILSIPAKNFLIPVDNVGTFCFAFAPSGSGLSIIGNIQQEGIQISIDAANGFVGFGPNIC